MSHMVYNSQPPVLVIFTLAIIHPPYFPSGSYKKKVPAVQETWVRSLSQEEPLEEMAIHSSILAWKISGTEEPGRLQSLESQRVRHD